MTLREGTQSFVHSVRRYFPFVRGEFYVQQLQISAAQVLHSTAVRGYLAALIPKTTTVLGSRSKSKWVDLEFAFLRSFT